MDEAELTGWLESNLALKKNANVASHSPPRTPEAMIDLTKRALAPQAHADLNLEQAQSSVRDVKIELHEDSLRAYTVFDLHGMDLSLELEGRLFVKDGYLRLEPTGGKLGSLPLLAGTLEGATKRLFDSPENKEKFRLPPHIRDVRIEYGRIIISSP